ncbi:DUF2510 domain-containing protein [Symbioplanes lichenis]|uniref:DUF2510 domain-containing protein n=1 Tax=Symbioplanes lichenis TaxID=1629072 RepID=UPI0027394A58|nr:DUF2510 domain-containing protein [Actinoplanes lichenis]
MSDIQQVPAGWYADPIDAAASRWWDGQRWTDFVEPAPATPAVPDRAPVTIAVNDPAPVGAAPVDSAPGGGESGGRRRPRRGGRSAVPLAVVVTFVVTAAAFVGVPRVYASLAGPELTAETASAACLEKGRELARSVEEDSGVGAYGTTVTIDDVTVEGMRESGDKYVGRITLHQLARNAYGSLRGSKSVGCAAYVDDATGTVKATLGL